MNSERRRHDIATVCSVSLFILLVLLGCFSLAVSLIPFYTIKSHTDAFTIDGSADILTSSFHMKVQVVLRLAGAFFLFVACILLFTWKNVLMVAGTFLHSVACCVRDMKLWFTNVRENDTSMHVCAMVILLLLSVVLRLLFMSQPMRYDESFTFMRYASKPLYIALSYYETPNNHMFHTLCVHCTYVLFGGSSWVIRLPAFVSGVLLVPASYVIIRVLYNKYAALMTAGLVACSSVLIEFSTNARGYMLICLAFCILLLFVIYLKRTNRAAAWFLFSFVSALGLYTIPVMVYPFGIAVTWFVLSLIWRDKLCDWRFMIKRLVLSVVGIIIITFVLYAPSFVVTGFHSVFANQFVSPRPLHDFLALVPVSLVALYRQWFRDIPVIVSLLVCVGFIISLVLHGRLSKHRVPVVLAVIVFCTPLLLLQRVIPYTRVWLFMLPVVLGMACAGIVFSADLLMSRLGVKKDGIFNGVILVLAIVLGLVVRSSTSILQSTDTGTLGDAQQITAYLADYLEPGDRVFALAPSEAPLEYYFWRQGVPITYLHADFARCHRIIAVVNEAYHITVVERQHKKQTIEELTRLLQPQVKWLSEPRLIKRFERATLYEIAVYDESKR